MRIKINHNVKQDENGYWWIVSKNNKKIRKISNHAIIKQKDGRWYLKKRNGSLSNKNWSTLQEAFDYSDTVDRLIAFGIFIIIVVILATIVNFL